jgi:hypothetical protein
LEVAVNEKKFKVGDAVVLPPRHRDAPRYGVVAWVGKRWLKVSFNWHMPDTCDRWDAFTGKKDSNYSSPCIMLVGEYEAQCREVKAREALFDVGVRVEHGSKLTCVAVLAAIKPLLEAKPETIHYKWCIRTDEHKREGCMGAERAKLLEGQ